MEEQELIAAKLMARWRSGAPLVLAPEKDDPALDADMQRNNDFTYKEMDPHGYAVPLGSHIRRINPRDTAHNLLVIGNCRANKLLFYQWISQSLCFPKPHQHYQVLDCNLEARGCTIWPGYT